jgi:hypothetical protein
MCDNSVRSAMLLRLYSGKCRQLEKAGCTRSLRYLVLKAEADAIWEALHLKVPVAIW